VKARIALILALTAAHLPAQPAGADRSLEVLLENAVRYAGGPPHVVLEVQRDGGHLEISVRDHGPGIDATSRELAGPANTAWQRVAGDGGQASITIGLTSVRDGQVQVAVDGDWSRRASGLAAQAAGPLQPTDLAGDVEMGLAARVLDVRSHIVGQFT